MDSGDGESSPCLSLTEFLRSQMDLTLRIKRNEINKSNSYSFDIVLARPWNVSTSWYGMHSLDHSYDPNSTGTDHNFSWGEVTMTTATSPVSHSLVQCELLCPWRLVFSLCFEFIKKYGCDVLSQGSFYPLALWYTLVLLFQASFCTFLKV